MGLRFSVNLSVVRVLALSIVQVLILLWLFAGIPEALLMASFAGMLHTKPRGFDEPGMSSWPRVITVQLLVLNAPLLGIPEAVWPWGGE